MPAKLHNIIRKFGTAHAECRRRAIFPRLGGDAVSEPVENARGQVTECHRPPLSEITFHDHTNSAEAHENNGA